MPAITPSFLYDLESNMRVITAQDYQRLVQNLWWTKIAKTMPSGAKTERVSWLLDSARIQRTGHGGNVEFEDVVAITTEVENLNAAAGLNVKKEQFEDLDGNGIDLASHWSRTIGAYAAYWPQKCISKAILANGLTYDRKAFFATDHPVNPFNLAAGTFTNLFTAGSGPGPCPIGGAITLDVALTNLAKAIAYIATIKLPTGEDPRFLRVKHILLPPALYARATQLTQAKYIAQAASAGGGSGDIESVIRYFGLGEPIECPELSAGFAGGADDCYYLACEDILTSELGAFNYVNREPFSVLFYGPQNDGDLARIRMFQWTTEGRNNVLNGHPYLLFKCPAT